jgi:hypothetical protein
MEGFFKGFTVQHIERAKNTKEDALAKVAARKAVLPSDIFFNSLKIPPCK